MTDTPSGAGPCVRGWAKDVPDWGDIRSAHWTTTPIIPIHHQLHPTTPINHPLVQMSFEDVANFQDFHSGPGHEGLYSSNKENTVLHPRGEAQGQGERPGVGSFLLQSLFADS